MGKTSDASKILKQRSGIDPQRDPEMLQIAEDYRVAQMIYDARTSVGLTQQQLADSVGTTQSVISQLEDADYDGHSLTMLRRIAAALNRRLEIRLVPDGVPSAKAFRESSLCKQLCGMIDLPPWHYGWRFRVLSARPD